jgi:hypothetical protein
VFDACTNLPHLALRYNQQQKTHSEIHLNISIEHKESGTNLLAAIGVPLLVVVFPHRDEEEKCVAGGSFLRLSHSHLGSTAWGHALAQCWSTGRTSGLCSALCLRMAGRVSRARCPNGQKSQWSMQNVQWYYK